MGHNHAHDHGPAHPASARVRRVLAAVLIPLGLAVVVGMAVLWPRHHPAAASGLGFDQQTAQGLVTATKSAPCSTQPAADAGSTSGSPATTGTDTVCTLLTIQLTAGPGAGGYIQQVVGDDPATPRYSAGDKVVLSYQPGAPAGEGYTLTDFVRGPPLALLAAVFAIVVAVVGRWRGLAALLALGVSFGLLVLFVLPAILDGSNALAVAVIGSAAIMLCVLYVTHGLSARTSIAVLGTLASLGLIAVLGAVFISLAKLTGLANEEVATVAAQYPQVDVPGLLLAGYIIGSLGVLDDVTVTQTSAVWELKHANPRLSARQLYRAGMRIGRDHIASTVNTLVMAYAGASLPLLLLFAVAGRSPGSVISTDLVAEDVVRALVGAIGLVAAVPLTTWLAAIVAGRERPGIADAHDAAPPAAAHDHEARRLGRAVAAPSSPPGDGAGERGAPAGAAARDRTADTVGHTVGRGAGDLDTGRGSAGRYRTGGHEPYRTDGHRTVTPGGGRAGQARPGQPRASAAPSADIRPPQQRVRPPYPVRPGTGTPGPAPGAGAPADFDDGPPADDRRGRHRR